MKQQLRLFLYSVSCSPLSSSDAKFKYFDKILLFCVDETLTTHVVQVQCYNTHVLLEPNLNDMKMYGDVSNLHSSLSDDIQKLIAPPIQTWNAVKLLGYTNSQPVPVLQISLKREHSRKWLLKKLRATMTVGMIRINQFLHIRRDAETQFLYDSGLHINTWFNVSTWHDNNSKEMFDPGVQVHMANFSSLKIITQNIPPPVSLRKMYIRIVAFSSTATQTNQYDPSSDIAADEVQCIGYALSNADNSRAYELNTFDKTSNINSEKTLLEAFAGIIEKSNIHVFVFASDERCCPNALVYLFRRAERYGINLHFSKLNTLTLQCEERACGADSTYLVFRHPGTEREDICEVLRKAQVSPNLDGFTLIDALRHPKLIINKEPFAKMLHLNYHGLNSFSKHDVIQEDVLMQVTLLQSAETDSDFTSTQLNISNICDLDLTSVCERGQQARVSNLFARSFYDQKIIINDLQVKEQYVVVRRSAGDSSYPDPPWLINPPPDKMRGEYPPQHIIRQALPTHLQHLLLLPHNNVFDITEHKTDELPLKHEAGDKDMLANESEADYFNDPEDLEKQVEIKNNKKRGWWSDKTATDFVRKSKKRKTTADNESKKRFKGGLVLEPEAGFYTLPEEAACTFDFGSLYPSIIEGYKLCYMRVIYDRKWLTDPDLECEYVPITSTECLVLAKTYKGIPVRTITPQIVSDIVQMRKRIRKKQEEEVKYSFQWNIFERAQLAAKVVQNSVYGYIGSDTSGMTCTALAAAVTQIGQWMNRNVRFIILFLGGLVLYGDTDSNMGRMWVASKHKTRDEIFASVYEQAFTIQRLGTILFAPPNKLEFEAVKIPFLLTNKKKTYAAIQLSSDENGWNLPPESKANIKGMALKKRDKCEYAQKIGEALILKLLKNNNDSIEVYEEWYTKELDKIPKGVITSIETLNPFVITCALNAEYKKETGVLALSLANMTAQETGARPRPGTRLAFVCAHFRDVRLHADTCVIPDIFLRRKDRIDIAYYLEKQIWNCVKQVLCLKVHEKLRERFDEITKRYINVWRNKRAGRQELTSFFKSVPASKRTVAPLLTTSFDSSEQDVLSPKK